MTNQTTHEFIAARSKVILKQINELRAELLALRNLKNTLSGKSNDSVVKRQRSYSQMTFQEMIVDVLNELPSKGAEATRIIDLIKEKHGKLIARESISPQLSRLKQKNVLQLNNNVWRLNEPYRVEKNEGPTGPSDSGKTLSVSHPNNPFLE